MKATLMLGWRPTPSRTLVSAKMNFLQKPFQQIKNEFSIRKLFSGLRKDLMFLKNLFSRQKNEFHHV